MRNGGRGGRRKQGALRSAQQHSQRHGKSVHKEDDALAGMSYCSSGSIGGSSQQSGENPDDLGGQDKLNKRTTAQSTAQRESSMDVDDQFIFRELPEVNTIEMLGKFKRSKNTILKENQHRADWTDIFAMRQSSMAFTL